MPRRLGVVDQERGRYVEARTCHRNAHELYSSLNDRRGMANQIGNLANIARIVGDFDEAVEKYQQALNLHSELNDSQGMARDLGNLADVFRLLGDMPRARDCQVRAIEIDRINQHSHLLSSDLGTLGLIAENEDHLEEAQSWYSEALDLFRMTGDKIGEIRTLTNLGNVARKRFEFDQAQGYYQAAVELSHSIKHTRGEVLALAGLGLVYQQRDPTHSLPYQHLAIRLAKQLGDSEINWRVLGGRGDTHRLLGKFSAAYRDYIKAIQQIEIVRSGLRAEPQRIGFVSAERQAPYMMIIKLLTHTQFYHAREAWEMCERARSRAFLDLLLIRTSTDRIKPSAQRVLQKSGTAMGFRGVRRCLASESS